MIHLLLYFYSPGIPRKIPVWHKGVRYPTIHINCNHHEKHNIDLSHGCVVFSCKETKYDKDPLTLYSEIDRTSDPNTLTENEKDNGWKLLFDGVSGNGWHGYNMKVFPDCWTIEDGSLTMTTTGSAESLDITYSKKYRNFALSLEYKLTKAANSGIIYQIAEDPKYKFPYETGPEFQVIDHENWPDKLEEWQINGANYAMYPPMVKPYKPLGEWNQLCLL